MATVQLGNVVKTYGAQRVVDDVSLSIADGEFVTLLGASGCGKTTCLRMVAGFVAPDAGRVVIGEKDVTALAPHLRDTGMVFQQYALFPHLDVAANVAFGLRVRKVPRAEVERRVHDALKLVRLEGFAARLPAQLSGGQKQRVALARAIVVNPRVLLLDEPLGALDQKLREELQAEIKAIQARLGITTLFVTHDQGEALLLSDRIAVMDRGRISQIDTPRALYERPANKYVAGFVGKTNFIDVELDGLPDAHGVQALRHGADATSIRLRSTASSATPTAPGGKRILSVRPENIEFGNHHPNHLRVAVEQVLYQGDGWQITVRAGDALQLQIRSHGSAPPRVGELLDVGWQPERSVLLDDAPAVRH
ncbi:MAG: ABC transporter ATP-binding protein [Pseudomonadota bacterium]